MQLCMQGDSLIMSCTFSADVIAFLFQSASMHAMFRKM